MGKKKKKKRISIRAMADRWDGLCYFYCRTKRLIDSILFWPVYILSRVQGSIMMRMMM